MKNNLIRSFMVTIAVLLIPFLAMQFTTEVNWDRGDFVIMGTLIFITSLIFSVAMGKIQNNWRRFLVAGLIILGFVYIWAELAVGIFTNLGS